MKQKFIEWFTKNNNGCSPAMEDDRSFVSEKTQHMFEAYQAGVAEGEARCAALAAENAALREYRPQPSGAAMMEALDSFYEYHEDVPEQGMMAAFEILCCKRPVTPATDSFLAEVRAQGVERLANAWYAIAHETDPGISISDSSRLKYRQRADDAADFANEIRQEAAQ
ncbi:hypothetical protein [Enterobacter ludwigii]|uniref:hypothetical protein n=1 Tax=Enterobacter ludwigii TaxID=299767 RepID=UPI0040678B9C